MTMMLRLASDATGVQVLALQVDAEAGGYLARHQVVLFGEAKAAKHLSVRGEHAPVSPRGSARAPLV